jgi:hypothetical protein
VGALCGVYFYTMQTIINIQAASILQGIVDIGNKALEGSGNITEQNRGQNNACVLLAYIWVAQYAPNLDKERVEDLIDIIEGGAEWGTAESWLKYNNIEYAN